MKSRVQRYLENFSPNPAASQSEIAAFEGSSGLTLPTDYREFLLFGNGGRGFIGQVAYAEFWPIEHLLKLNGVYEAPIYLPGFLLIGSDGGGEAYAFRVRDLQWDIFQVPFVGMNLDETQPLAATFTGLIEFLYGLQ